MSSRKQKIKFGIDFGTKYCLIGYYNIQQNRPELYEDQIISCLAFINGFLHGPILMGEEAMNSTSSMKIVDIKKVIGREKEEIQREDQDNWNYRIIERNSQLYVEMEDEQTGNAKHIHVETVVSLMLSNIIDKMLDKLGGRDKFEIELVVIPVPVEFDDRQRFVIEHALKVIGINNVLFINEPVSALFAFQHEFQNEILENETVMVIDFGGGTLDISTCENRRGRMIANHVGGDQNLGGLNFDSVMKKMIIAQLKDSGIDHLQSLFTYNKRREVPAHKRKRMQYEMKIIKVAEEMKIELSKVNAVSLKMNKVFSDDEIEQYHLNELEVIITREDYEHECQHLFDRFSKILKKAYSKRTKKDTQKVIMVGGSCCIPKIQAIVKEIIGDDGKIVMTDFDPLTAVCKGAILQANLEECGIDKEPYDTIAQPLGLMLNGKIQRFANDGDTLPIRSVIPVKPQTDNQKSATFKIYRGNSLYPGPDCKYITSFTISDIPPLTKQEAIIEVETTINKSGVIEVSARVINTDVQGSLTTTLDLSQNFASIQEILEEYLKFISFRYNQI